MRAKYKQLDTYSNNTMYISNIYLVLNVSWHIGYYNWCGKCGLKFKKYYQVNLQDFIFTKWKLFKSLPSKPRFYLYKIIKYFPDILHNLRNFKWIRTLHIQSTECILATFI